MLCHSRELSNMLKVMFMQKLLYVIHFNSNFIQSLKGTCYVEQVVQSDGDML